VNIYSNTSRRRLAGIRYVAQALGGCLAGLALGGAAGVIGARLFAGTSDGWGDLIAAIVGAMIGYTIGVSIGVDRVGRWLNSRAGVSTKRGAYWLALLGSVLGVGLVLLAAEPLRLNQNTALLQAFLIGVPPLAATFAFNMRRKARR
jgi:hypothetical protein